MDEIFTKYLLEGDKFMSEMHLKQPGLTYTVWDPNSYILVIFIKMN